MFYNQKNKLEWLLNSYLLSSGINVPHFRLLKHIAWILKVKRVYNGKIENVKHVNVSFEKLDQTLKRPKLKFTSTVNWSLLVRCYVSLCNNCHAL